MWPCAHPTTIRKKWLQNYLKCSRAHRITGWRRGQKLYGQPDFVFRNKRVCVFVDGCFWHGCPKHGSRPKQNRKFWDAKIARNKERDKEVTSVLRSANWQVLRIWEHELQQKNERRLLQRLRRLLVANAPARR